MPVLHDAREFSTVEAIIIFAKAALLPITLDRAMNPDYRAYLASLTEYVPKASVPERKPSSTPSRKRGGQVGHFAHA